MGWRNLNQSSTGLWNLIFLCAVPAKIRHFVRNFSRKLHDTDFGTWSTNKRKIKCCLTAWCETPKPWAFVGGKWKEKKKKRNWHQSWSRRINLYISLLQAIASPTLTTPSAKKAAPKKKSSLNKHHKQTERAQTSTWGCAVTGSRNRFPIYRTRLRIQNTWLAKPGVFFLLHHPFSK